MQQGKKTAKRLEKTNNDPTSQQITQLINDAGDIEALLKTESDPKVKATLQKQLDSVFRQSMFVMKEGNRGQAIKHLKSYIDALSPIAFMFGGQEKLIDYFGDVFYITPKVLNNSGNIEYIEALFSSYTGIQNAFLYRIFADFLSRRKEITHRIAAQELAQKFNSLIHFYNIGYYEEARSNGSVWGISPTAPPQSKKSTVADVYPEPKNKEYSQRRRLLAIDFILELMRMDDISAANKMRIAHLLTGIAVPEKGIKNSGFKGEAARAFQAIEDDPTMIQDCKYLADFFDKVGLPEIAQIAKNRAYE